jgi:peroxiredoxin
VTQAAAQSLTAQVQALYAERKRTWEPDKLRRNVDQRRALVAAFDPAKAVRPGDQVDDFTLGLSTRGTISRDQLLADGPAVLVFFRLAGCPACNLALPYYDRLLFPALNAAGIPLAAVSPHLPEQGLDAIRTRHDLRLTVASDRNNALARRLGLTFVPHDDPATPVNDASWIGALTGTDTWELPQPAVILIDAEGIVRFADISPDWLVRTEASSLLEALTPLQVAVPALK